ncbi:MAG: T9SS type A sorting domain-containing protein [Bacteroidetes bacterium]|nr:T9SS type A sorting domain-containing protein [Bacteroidota bacterium]
MNLRFVLTAFCVVCLTTSFAQPCGFNPKASASPSPYCHGRPFSLFGTATGTGLSYSWTGPNTFSASTQNTSVTFPFLVNSTGYYKVTVSKPGCTSESDSVYILIHGTPALPTAYAKSGVCLGDTLKLYYTYPFAVVMYCTWWGPNGHTGHGTAPIYNDLNIPNATLADTGMYFLTIQDANPSLRICYSDTVSIHIDTSYIYPTHPPLPVVNLTVTPSINVALWGSVLFRANTTNAGNAPKFQWLKNGVAITGKTDSTYMATTGIDFVDGDTISCRIIRGPVCIDTAYSSLIVYHVGTGIQPIAKENELSIYPNPNNGNFTIKGSFVKGQKVQIETINTLGQVVSAKEMVVSSENAVTVKNEDLPTGVYYLIIQDNTTSYHARFVIEN